MAAQGTVVPPQADKTKNKSASALLDSSSGYFAHGVYSLIPAIAAGFLAVSAGGPIGLWAVTAGFGALSTYMFTQSLRNGFKAVSQDENEKGYLHGGVSATALLGVSGALLATTVGIFNGLSGLTTAGIGLTGLALSPAALAIVGGTAALSALTYIILNVMDKSADAFEYNEKRGLPIDETAKGKLIAKVSSAPEYVLSLLFAWSGQMWQSFLSPFFSNIINMFITFGNHMIDKAESKEKIELFTKDPEVRQMVYAMIESSVVTVLAATTVGLGLIPAYYAARFGITQGAKAFGFGKDKTGNDPNGAIADKDITEDGIKPRWGIFTLFSGMSFSAVILSANALEKALTTFGITLKSPAVGASAAVVESTIGTTASAVSSGPEAITQYKALKEARELEADGKHDEAWKKRKKAYAITLDSNLTNNVWVIGTAVPIGIALYYLTGTDMGFLESFSEAFSTTFANDLYELTFGNVALGLYAMLTAAGAAAFLGLDKKEGWQELGKDMGLASPAP